jgi:PqqA peptide cyclase
MDSTPLALIAELTHRCPLHCVYCSNPVELQSRAAELDTATWLRVFREAAEMGILQVDLTGGEPLARPDLEQLVAGARTAKLYVNLITSGIGLTQAKLDALLSAGLDHLQLSFQDVEESAADEIAGTRAHSQKLALARAVRGRHVALTMNIVVHRKNLDRLEEMIALAEELKVQRLEIANVQYYGWALANREALLPTRGQLQRSVATVTAAQERLKGSMRIDFVVPDYYATFPKPCMGGWGRKMILLDPAGRALPCHSAGVIPGLQFDSVRECSLPWIWQHSSAFRKFRGEEWMPEPCRSCDRRTQDFGGCRCQAFLVAGDAAATDPVCSLAPTRHVIDAAVQQVNSNREFQSSSTPPAFIYRNNPDLNPATRKRGA